MPSPLPAFNALTASARQIMPRAKWKPQYDKWQDQLWDYYDRLGEFEAAIMWRANTMSRIRLIAAELSTTGEEPTPIEHGPAAELVSRLAGGTGGQAQLMKETTIHIGVPGEGWLVGEQIPGEDGEHWYVVSADELRVDPKQKLFQIREGPNNKTDWRLLSADTVVMRFWDPHPRFGWQANSDSRHAMDAMLELDLINKRIIAEIVSRLSSNGVLLYDKQKLSFPPAEGQPADATATDQFAEILVAVASQGIANPMSPEATLPIPIGFDLGDIASLDPKFLMQHVKFSDFLDEKLLTERDSAVKRLATSMDMPNEILLGTAGMNHWGAWQIEETGIKIHIAPKAELICHSLTQGYLVPALKASGSSLVGPNGGRLVIWYDPSEITVRPDRSANTLAAYDRGEVTGDALRREIGLNEDGDKPKPSDDRAWTTKFLMRQPATAPGMLDELGGPDIRETPEEEEPEAAQPPTEEEDVEQDTPDQETERPDTDMSSMSDAELQVLVSRLSAEIQSRRKPTSFMVEAGIPMDTRVTPVRRNGTKESAEVS